MEFENVILKGLTSDQEYTRRVIPYLTRDYFENKSHQALHLAFLKVLEIYKGDGKQHAIPEIMSDTLSKAQDKTSAGEHRGIFITARNFKSRLTREKGVVKLNLSFTHGLDRYYGLLEIAERGGLVTKMSTKYTLPDGQSAKESVIYNNPTKYFTPEFLDMIDKVAGDLFKYGGKADDSLAENVVESDEDE